PWLLCQRISANCTHSAHKHMSKQQSKQLHIELRTGETLKLSDGVSLKLQFKKGRAARFLLVVPGDVAYEKLGAPSDLPAPSAAN
ncbi:MAG: hypothetical protein RR584_11520, partial [Comamonas sp.]